MTLPARPASACGRSSVVIRLLPPRPLAAASPAMRAPAAEAALIDCQPARQRSRPGPCGLAPWRASPPPRMGGCLQAGRWGGVNGGGGRRCGGWRGCRRGGGGWVGRCGHASTPPDPPAPRRACTSFLVTFAADKAGACDVNTPLLLGAVPALWRRTAGGWLSMWWRHQPGVVHARRGASPPSPPALLEPFARDGGNRS